MMRSASTWTRFTSLLPLLGLAVLVNLTSVGCRSQNLPVGSNDGDHPPIGSGTGTGGDSAATGQGDPGPRTGIDGICGAYACPQGQQCCFSTGKCVAPTNVAQDCPPLTPKPAFCGGVTCAANQICCRSNGQCIDPTTASATCVKPAPPDADPSRPADETPCASDVDCLPTQFCWVEARGLCVGRGFCISRSNCGESTGTSICGCDGVTYPDVQSACRVRVRINGIGACGTLVDLGDRPGSPARDPAIFCGTSDQCPTGQHCCGLTGRCYDVNIPYLCSIPPPGTNLPCIEDRQCPDGQFCLGAGCSGPGGCIGPTACNGELKPVCGCDGKSYTNPACAQAASVRTAHDGVCSSADAGT